jgi:hypothetical protein
MLFAIACGSSSSSSDAGPDSAAIHVPKVHRTASNPCADPRPATMVPSGIPNAPCTKDADCTTAKNGRCVSLTAGNVKCSYDECTMDSECGSSSVCSCREPNNAFANTCEHGNCKTDADCGGKYCSPSGFPIDVYCRSGIPLGSFGFFCHTAKDDCTDDADCAADASYPPACVFDAVQSRWTCMPMMCVD